ncbi:MAG: Ig-like domain-containing protein [Muribaculaceae bacterium]|nr:Ig-like domain-containing protein [Muribaculaceae bacterium]
MKKNNIFGAALVVACGAALSLASCDDDKQFTLDGDQAFMLEEISFDVSETLPLAVGMDSTITYTVLPEDATNKNVVFSSSDESVATVDPDGTIHALAEGMAIVTARSEIGFKVFEAEATVVVNVIPEIIKAQQIDVICLTEPDDEGKYYVTDELQFTTEILPADHTYSRVHWTTGDENIATVDQTGLVKCLAMGDVTIHAHATDHSGVRGEYKLHINRNVSVERVEIAPVAEPLCLTRGAYALDVTYFPADGTIGSVEWESDDETVLTVHRGVVTPRGFGSANITATCPETGSKTSVSITVDPGWYIWDAQNKWNGWIITQPGNHCDPDNPEDRDNGVWHINLKVPAVGGKWRADIKYDCSEANPMYMYTNNYPVFAMRMTRIGNMNSTLDATTKPFGNAGTPNPKNGIDLGDGTQLLIYNVATRPNYVGQIELPFSLFQIKIADIPYDKISLDKPYYEVYWMRTFKSEDEAKAFAQAEVAAGK